VRIRARQLKETYNEIKTAVADIAKKKGIDIVLVNNGNDLPDNAEERKPDDIANMIFTRQVLYVSDNADITAQVLATLDANFAKPAMPPAPAAPGH